MLSCAIEAAVCSSAAACCSVRALRSLLPWAISFDPVAMLALLERTCVTMPASASLICPMAAMMLPRSSGASATRADRSPRATARASAAAAAGSPPTASQTARRIQMPKPARPTAARLNKAHCHRIVVLAVDSKAATDASANAVESLTVASTPARCAR